MCGICGFAGNGDQTDLKAMTDALTHRGPDDAGYWQDLKRVVHLGHRRLSVIDIAGGKQPMVSGNGTCVIVYNGEIYNAPELKKELVRKGHTFKTDHSDTEVLLQGYLEWGEELPKQLNGMWAFCIYDIKNEKFFLSRDRFAKKPLYYTVQNHSFVFASELTSLARHSGVTAAISKRSLKKYFAYGYIPSPHSLYKRIHKLPGGCNLTIDIGSLSIGLKKYWEFVLEPFQSIPKNAAEVWSEELLDLLSKAVQRRMMADVPLGVFLSGGIDSSAITAFAAQKTSKEVLKTFSIGFEEDSFNESAYAEATAEAYQTEHHATIFSLEKALAMLPDIAERLDEPMGDSSLLPTYLLCRETRKHVTVALSGEGGDELFAGYDPFRALRLAEFYDKLCPRPIHSGIRILFSRLPVSHRNMSLDFKIKRTLRGLSYAKNIWNPVWMAPLDPSELEELFSEDMDMEDIYSEAIDCWEACEQPDIVDKTLQFFTQLYLQNDILTKIDRASMLNSLEARAPFLDADMVDFVRRIPSNWKFRNGRTKYILKKALKGIVPEEILHRPKKGFGIPISKWIQCGNIGGIHGDRSGFLNEGFINKKYTAHMRKKEDNGWFLWDAWLLNQHVVFQ